MPNIYLTSTECAQNKMQKLGAQIAKMGILWFILEPTAAVIMYLSCLCLSNISFFQNLEIFCIPFF